MNERNVYELAEEIRRKLHETVDQRVDDFILRMESGNAETAWKLELPLTMMPAYFKEKKIRIIVYPDGTEVTAPTWKKAAAQLLQSCAENEAMHESCWRSGERYLAVTAFSLRRAGRG